jgi:DNA-binding MarR family transcriptional regulator
MTSERLSRLQRRILAWLLPDARRTWGTMSASHQDLACALAHDQDNLSTSLKGLERKGLVTITWTPGGSSGPDPQGANPGPPLTGSYD